MAKILLGAMLGEIRGKQGGTVFSRNRYANYTRQKTVPVNPRTSAQTVARALLSSMAKAWSVSLTEEQRIEWNDAAAMITKTNNLGVQYNRTGFNYFVGTNFRVRKLNPSAAILLTPPPAPTNDFIDFTVVSYVIDTLTTTPSAEFLIDWNTQNGNPTTLPTGIGMEIQSTAPVSPGLMFIEESAYHEHTTVVADSPPTSIIASYPFPLVQGNKIFSRARTVDLNSGDVSPWVETSAIVA